MMPKFNSFKHKGDKKFNGREERKPKLGHLPEEMLSYYRQVAATLEAGFDDDDPGSKRDFLTNVYQALKDEGLQASQNQTVSRILEKLFIHSEALHLRILFCQFCKDLATVSFDRFASHVFQSLIQYLPTMYDDSDMESADKASLQDSLHLLCQFTTNHMEKLSTDTYGSHVLRSLLEMLGGARVKEEVVRSHMSRNQRKDTDFIPKHPESADLSTDFKQQFDKIRDKFLANCTYQEELQDANFCPILQTLLLVLHKSRQEEFSHLADTIMEKACPSTEVVEPENLEKNLPAVVKDSIGSYLIELLVGLTPADEMSNLYKRLFKGKMVFYAVHPMANYILQKFLSCVTDKSILRELLEELSPILEDVMAVNNMGVIVKLAEACRTNQHQQEQFTQAVMKAFHCDEPKDRQDKIVPLIAAMQTFETFYDTGDKDSEEKSTEKPSPSLLKWISIHGSLVLQQMLCFHRPKRLVSSLLALSPAELSNLASDPSGSHALDAFFTSSTVWDKNKEEFLKKLTGFYVQVACSKNGSRCLEGIWKCCSVKMKALIAEDLVKSRGRIESDRFGHFLYKSFALLKFATRKKDWMEFQSGQKKKQQMLQAILEGTTGRKKRKSRKRKAASESTKENEGLPANEIGEQNDLANNEKSSDQQQVPDKQEKRKIKKRKMNSEETSVSEEPKTPKDSSAEKEKKKRKRVKNKKKKLKQET